VFKNMILMKFLQKRERLSGIHGIIIGEKPRDRKAPGNEWKKPYSLERKYLVLQISNCKVQNAKCQRKRRMEGQLKNRGR